LELGLRVSGGLQGANEMNRKLNHALASLVLMYSATAWSQETVMATIEGPGEYTMSGSTECGGKATSTIQPGE
jgi:hypothetical protein